ncbi:hypothetical protein K1X84_10000, partial [bacterium]|nr:hypothetical protein [bacterium]
KTGIYGQIKNIRTYKLDQGVLKILKEDKRMYQFSKDLLTTNVTPVNGVAADQKSRWLFKSANDCVSYTNTPIGLIQQKYWTKNEDDPVTYINHIKQGVYLVGTQSVEYFYDPNNNSNGSSSITNYNIAFDANAGLVLTTEFKDSKGDRIVNENRPAYWFYSSMKNKNMLTQMAEQRLYDISAAAGEVLVYDPSHQCDGTIESWILPHLKSASITTWKNWLTAGTDWNNDGSIDYLDQIWRQNDTYTSNKIGSSFVYFSNWTVADNETSNPGNYDLPNGWKRTSNITAYDRFGHPTEERGLDGTYTSSIYGYGDALPVAIAQNALNTQIKFFNFEDPANASGGKTGAYSKSYSGTVAELSTPSVTGTYVISGWVKPTSSTTINGVSYPANGQWQFFEVKNLAQNTTLSITAGAGNIDDVRIHPVEATMSTFTYDILTWKVTAISDANSIITYYEYDDVGRLIKVFDQDKNMIKKHTYQYKRNVN